MRFTSAFTFTLLSASTILADGLSPYAGFRLPDRFFQSAAATFNVPKLFCNSGEIAFVGAEIGNPSCTSGGGIEAGVVLTCDDEGIYYRPFWRLYPDIAHFWRSLDVNEGDKIRVEVFADPSGGVNLTIENQTNPWKLRPFPLETVKSPDECLQTALWGLRANVEGGELQAIPSFDGDIILYELDAWDNAKHSYGTRNARQELMRGSSGQVVASASRDRKSADPYRTIRIKS